MNLTGFFKICFKSFKRRIVVSFDINVEIYDPWADIAEVKHEYGIDIIKNKKVPDLKNYTAVILAVAHDLFDRINIEKSTSLVVFDVKGKLPKEKIDARL